MNPTLQTMPSAPDAVAAQVPEARPPKRMSLQEALEEAHLMQRTERLDAAEAIYLEILAQVPDEPNCLHFLGILRHQQGRRAEAVELLQRAIELVPDHAGLWLNLGNVLIEAEQFEPAAQVLARAIELDPGSAMAHNNLGIAHMRRDDMALAEQAFLSGLALEPERSDLHFNYARLLYVTGRLRESAAHSMRSIAANRELSASRKLLSMAQAMLGENDQAIQTLLEWKALEPDNPEIDHHLAACGGVDVPARAPDHYVQRVFDDFAASFDHRLKELGYRAPQLMADALRQVQALLPAEPVVLDAGCGTGLCGPLLKPPARVLDGVDLSAGMLERARARPEYDALHHAELTAYLDACEARYDLIVSADTLCYFGELDGFLASAARVLRGPSLLIFSLEVLPDEAADFRLNLHGRYSHSKTYLLRSLAARGFELRALEQQVLRQELIESVQGWIVTAQHRGGEA